jgi:hypothetical protein
LVQISRVSESDLASAQEFSGQRDYRRWILSETQVEREWRWLYDALNTVARVRAEQGEAQAFRLMQQAMRVGQGRRVELRMRMVTL